MASSLEPPESYSYGGYLNIISIATLASSHRWNAYQQAWCENGKGGEKKEETEDTNFPSLE